MGKISPVSAKYIIHANINIEGVVDRPDVIGAIFGQTEGLLGSDLELRELQRSGRIGRIEVNVETRSGKTNGSIVIPSSLDKAETSIVGAALEVIQRIGPCNAKIAVENIEDVRISKRAFVIERAKELLKKMMDGVIPDSQEIADEVAHSVRVMEIKEYGKDRLPAGPAVEESDEIIIVEGRADVINLLKHGIKNGIAINGTSVPQTIVELCKQKIVTVFVDGDRGGDLNIKELLQVAEVDFITKAPDGKEVEELTKKEIHKSIRSKVSAEQMKLEISDNKQEQKKKQPLQQQYSNRPQRPQPTNFNNRRPQYSQSRLSTEQKTSFKNMLEDLIGTRGAYILDENQNILGKVPVTELATTLKGLTGVHAVVFDGSIDRILVQTAERINVKYAVAMDAKVRQNETRVRLLTVSDL
ncbi:DNA primase [Candidatus Woesearchaeota archaeon]|nr:DNA primase [Candidatus Woesearchaeota archaeon]MBW3022132.1 DNA primase [Candidatus Woesearchaeota archaeon]